MICSKSINSSIKNQNEAAAWDDSLDAKAGSEIEYIILRDREYIFEGPNGNVSLHDLFDGRRQLIVYHFMMAPGSDHRCPGCSSFVDNIGHLAHLHARDTTLILVSPASWSQIEPFKERMGWTDPGFLRMATPSTTIAVPVRDLD